MSECIACGELFAADGDLCPVCLVRRIRIELADARDVVTVLEQSLKLAERAAGCRPGDGSDQPGLFSVAAPSLFGE